MTRLEALGSAGVIPDRLELGAAGVDGAGRQTDVQAYASRDFWSQ